MKNILETGGFVPKCALLYSYAVILKRLKKKYW